MNRIYGRNRFYLVIAPEGVSMIVHRAILAFDEFQIAHAELPGRDKFLNKYWNFITETMLSWVTFAIKWESS